MTVEMRQPSQLINPQHSTSVHTSTHVLDLCKNCMLDQCTQADLYLHVTQLLCIDLCTCREGVLMLALITQVCGVIATMEEPSMCRKS